MSSLDLNRSVLAGITQNHQAIRALERVFKDVGDTLPDAIEAALQQALLAVASANQALAAIADLAQGLDQLLAAPAPMAAPPAEDFAPATVLYTLDDDYAPRIQVGTIASQDADNVDITGGTIGLFAGTVGAPSLTWGGETTTGWYRVAANSLGVSVSGTKRIGVDSLGLNVTGIVDVTGSFVRAGSATPGGGGQYRMRDDSGAQRWLAGLLGTVGERTYSIYDIVTGNAWIQVAISGIVTLPGALVVASGANITGAFQVFGATTLNGNLVSTGACQISGAFGCNGKGPQGAASPGATATDLPTAIARVNQLAAVLSANGICT